MSNHWLKGWTQGIDWLTTICIQNLGAVTELHSHGWHACTVTVCGLLYHSHDNNHAHNHYKHDCIPSSSSADQHPVGRRTHKSWISIAFMQGYITGCKIMMTWYTMHGRVWECDYDSMHHVIWWQCHGISRWGNFNCNSKVGLKTKKMDMLYWKIRTTWRHCNTRHWTLTNLLLVWWSLIIIGMWCRNVSCIAGAISVGSGCSFCEN